MLSLPIYRLGTVYYLHTRIGGRQVKRSLGTGYKREALRRALTLLHKLTMDPKNPPIPYTLDIANGILQADGDDDHRRMMEALAAMTALKNATPPAPAPVAPTVQDDDPNTLRLGELLEKFFLLRKQLKQATATSYKNCITELSKFLKNPPITHVTASDVTRYQEFLSKKGNSTRTIDNKVSTIRALYNFGKKQGYTRQENPAADRALMTKKQRLQGGYAIFEREEVAQFCASPFFQQQRKKDPDYTNAVLLGLFTGCRVGEITALKRDQFKTSPKGVAYIVIRDSKTLAGQREVPIHPLAFAYLKPFIDSKTGKVFKYAERDGKGAGNAVGKKFARNLESARIDRDKLVFHSLRKFVNNELMNNGVTLEQRCQIIGHELDNVNVSTYTKKLTIDELAAAAFPTFEGVYSLIASSLAPSDSIDLSILEGTLM